MNIFQALYCNQHYELKPKGKASSARVNGNRLLGIALAFNLIFIFVILMAFIPSFADSFSDVLRELFGRRQGRTVGRLVAIIPFLIFMPLVQLTIGSPNSYDRIIKSFESCSLDQQKSISQKGLYYFIASIVGAFLAVILILIFLS